MLKRLVGFIIATAWMLNAGAQEQTADSIPITQRPVQAVGEVLVVNGIIHCLGRYVLEEPFSQTTMRSIRHNFHSKFAWDDDNFYVNQFGHAYQGSLYFNAARSNGLSFLQSVPYTTFGAISWEYLGEREQPSINDIMTTTIAGSFMGEVTHQIPQHIINEHERGARRFFKEAIAAAFNPVEGFHRLVSGRAWKVKPRVTSTLGEETLEDKYSLTLGGRYVNTISNGQQGYYQPYLAFTMEYGEVADDESHTKPFDFFSIDGALACGHDQHLLSHLYMTGRICSTPVVAKEKSSGELGLYQYFFYEDTKLPGEMPRGPFPFGEMASLGPGVMFVFPRVAPHLMMEQRFYTRGIALGAVESDYYKFYNRHYNMGSGYGISSLSKLSWTHVGDMELKAHYMHLYTWKGYEPRDLSELVFEDNYLNVLGDRSNARLLALSLQLHGRLSQQMALALGTSYYSRHTHYKYHPSHHAESYELRAGIQWHF